MPSPAGPCRSPRHSGPPAPGVPPGPPGWRARIAAPSPSAGESSSESSVSFAETRWAAPRPDQRAHRGSGPSVPGYGMRKWPAVAAARVRGRNGPTCGGGSWPASGASSGPPCVALCASSTAERTFRDRRWCAPRLVIPSAQLALADGTLPAQLGAAAHLAGFLVVLALAHHVLAAAPLDQ